MSFGITSHFETIPIFDLRQFNSQNAQERKQFITHLLEVCHNIGFFYIKNHGITSTLLERILHLTKVFFDLPQHEKEAICISQSPHYRGYGKLGAEVTQGIADYKESYDLGLEQSARKVTEDKPYLILQGPNQWPIARV